jgi:excisionase family DNA binding protein
VRSLSERQLPILGEDGPVVVISSRVAQRIAPPLVSALRSALRDGQVVDEEVTATVLAIEQVGHSYAAQRVLAGTEKLSSESGSAELPHGTQSATVPEMSTDVAAARLGCTPRHVVGLIAQRRLSARRIGRGPWLVEAASVDAYRTRRAG